MKAGKSFANGTDLSADALDPGHHLGVVEGVGVFRIEPSGFAVGLV
jgi:hypothetical protein